MTASADKLARLDAILGPDVTVASAADLAKLPVIRKDALLAAQAEEPPFGPLRPAGISHIFQSPGPIYEAGCRRPDWWRVGRFLTAMGVGEGDIAQNTFSYHFTPAGAMFEAGAAAVGAVVVPTGPGNSAQQAEMAAAVGTTTYVGTPDFLNVILEKGDAAGLDLSRITKAAVSAGPLFPQLRQGYADRGILCRQMYGTADVGLIAYESADVTEGMFIDQDVIVEIVSPGTGDPLPDGEIGEVLVTLINPDYPLTRFSVGDLSAIMPGDSGDAERARIVGWRGRADQAAKVRGMFIRPEQVAALVKGHDGIDRARIEISFDGKADQVTLRYEGNAPLEAVAAAAQDAIKLRAEVEAVENGALPRDGVLVADGRAPLT